MNKPFSKQAIAIQYLLLFYILAIASVYMGLLISLHLIWFPQWISITPGNIENNFNQPVQKAVDLFKPLVIIMNLFSLTLVLLKNNKSRRYLLISLFLLVLFFTFISVKYIIPLNRELSELSDERIIREKLIHWMKYSDVRMLCITIIWLLALVLLTMPLKLRATT